MSVGRVHPVVVWAGVFFTAGANEGQMLDASDIGRIGSVQVAAGERFAIQRRQRSARDHLPNESVVFGLAAVAPMNRVRSRERLDLVDPVL